MGVYPGTKVEDVGEWCEIVCDTLLFSKHWMYQVNTTLVADTTDTAFKSKQEMLSGSIYFLQAVSKNWLELFDTALKKITAGSIKGVFPKIVWSVVVFLKITGFKAFIFEEISLCNLT